VLQESFKMFTGIITLEKITELVPAKFKAQKKAAHWLPLFDDVDDLST